jgi:predicted aldo/keto reductase-like oxidoreductase
MAKASNRHQQPVSGWIIFALWTGTAVLAYLGIGGLIQDLIEGIDGSMISKTLPIIAILAVIGSIVASIRWARWARASSGPDAISARGLARRRFLVGAGATLGGVAATAAAIFARISGWALVTSPAVQVKVPRTDPNPHESWKGSRVRAYRRLGRTNFKASDISLGSGRIRPENDGETIARAAIDRGVNYFDTAPDYSANGSEIALGRAMKGHRDGMFVATKFCTANGHLQVGSSVRQYMEVVEGSLERLQTDYVDLVHIHACDTLERLLDPNVHEAFDRLREQGKARFLGVSTHTPNLEAVADAALDSNRFDVMMLAYHHGSWPRLGEIVDRAARQDVAVVAMKTLKGARHRGMAEFRRDADSFSQAAFKWVLANPSVSCLVISFFEHQHVDEYLAASGKPLTERDLAVLERYDGLIAGTHCFPHCGACLDSCPESLRIDDVLRYRMYAEDYGDGPEARRLYARLEKNASVCVGCSAPCAGSCPHGVPIRERTVGAHRMLAVG